MNVKSVSMRFRSRLIRDRGVGGGPSVGRIGSRRWRVRNRMGSGSAGVNACGGWPASPSPSSSDIGTGAKKSSAQSQTRDGDTASVSSSALPGSARLLADDFVEEALPSTSNHSAVNAGSHSSNNDVSGPNPALDAGGTGIHGLTGSAKLFSDALREEQAEESHSSSFPSTSASESSTRTTQLLSTHAQSENWTGDERIQDTVLRMLVDKYKPLRGSIVRSAEEKLKSSPPLVRSNTDSEWDWSKRANEPLLPAIEGHKPWHTTFTPPSTLTPRVKLGSSSPPSKLRSGDDGGARQDIAAARRSATAQRLGRARESTIDYKLGLSPQQLHHSHQQQPRRPPPAGLKAWSNLIEERIERARVEGQFKMLKGRGKPIARESAETNPFIAREEFLMNRVVQRNQAAPPWVEMQSEVENAIQSFRTILRQTWTRRAILFLTSTRTSSSLLTLTLADVQALRDPSWAAREASYHATALREVNELVRRYNGVAPYAVRKVYFEREKELERMYVESGEDVLEGVRERVRKGAGRGGEVRGVGDDLEDDRTGPVGRGNGSGRERRIGIWEMVRMWIASLRT